VLKQKNMAHPWLGNQEQVQMLCCGNTICKDCDDGRAQQIVKLDKQFEKDPSGANLYELQKTEKLEQLRSLSILIASE